MRALRGDVGVKDGKIVELGKLSGPAKRTIDAEGRVVAPGFVDNHCHYDAQVTWDPLCSFSPDHGCTTVMFGNCSLALAPVRPGSAKRVAEFLSYVEAIPMEALNTVDVDWGTIPQYMDRLAHHLGSPGRGLMARLSDATGRTVIYNNLGQTVREPDLWKKHMARVDETSKAGIRAYPLCSPNRVTQSFTMRNCQVFRGSPTWLPILLSSDEEKLKAYADPPVRQKLHDEVIEHKVEVPAAGYSRKWYDYMWIETPLLEKTQGLTGKPTCHIAKHR